MVSRTQHLIFLLLSLSMLLGLFSMPGCYAGHEVYLDSRHPKEMYPCRVSPTNDRYLQSTAAMIVSLQDEGWRLWKVDWQKGRIDAMKCYREYSASMYCVKIVVRISSKGNIEIVNPSDARMHFKMVRHAKRWMAELAKTFGKYACFREEILRKEVEKYGPVPLKTQPKGIQ